MLIKPNRTQLRAEIVNVHPASDGIGSELEVRVIDNHSEAAQDFLKPAAGKNLTVYSRRALTPVAKGDIVDVAVELKAGPFGQRVTCRELKKIPAA